tara:strand:+ start:20113 stop:21234 length:1122 start_codon:yes stop_codon:yes gene_type:complete
MRVAIFLTYNYSIQTWDNYGTLIRELEIYNKLNKNYKVDFVFFSYGDVSDLEIIKKYSNFKVIPMFKNRKFNNKLFTFFFSLIIPFRYIKEINKCDLIHQHQLLGSWVVLALKILTRKPVLIRTGYDMYEFSLLNSENYFKSLFLFLLTYLSLKFSNLYTVASNSDLNFLQSHFKFDTRKIKIRPNWVKETKAKEISSRQSDRVFSAGRLESQKNYTELIKCFPNDSKYHLEIIGEGTQEMHLRKLITNAKYKVSIHNNIEHASLLNKMNNYKYFISSSLFEGNPKTILEAMSIGCIVIASDIKNHRELIEHKKNGILFDLNSMNIVEIIDEIEIDLKLQNKLSSNAINSVIKNNHIDKLSKNMYEDYKLLLR